MDSERGRNHSNEEFTIHILGTLQLYNDASTLRRVKGENSISLVQLSRILRRPRCVTYNLTMQDHTGIWVREWCL
jgi:hypothetical protein